MDGSLEYAFDLQRSTFSRVTGTATLEELKLCAELRSADALVRIADALEALAATTRE